METLCCPKCGKLCTSAIKDFSGLPQCERCQLLPASDDRKEKNSITIFESERQQQAVGQMNHVPPLSPKKIYIFLEQYIVGQENAKKVFNEFSLFKKNNFCFVKE
jgi:ATP-dependent protease Clp ATPase subunit